MTANIPIQLENIFNKLAGTLSVTGTFWQSVQPVSLDSTDSTNITTIATETTAAANALGTTADSAWSSGNGTLIALLKNLANKLAGSVAVTGTFWQATQPVSIASSVAVTGTFFQTTQPVSISATVNTSDAANGSVTGGTAGSKSELGGLVYNTTLPTLTNTQQAALQGDSSSRLLVNVATGTVSISSGTVTANLGSTDTANLAATAGALGTTADSSWGGSGSGSIVAILKNIATKLAGSVSVTGTFFQATQPVSGTFWQTTQPVSIAATVNTSDAANGSVTGGTAGSKSELSGLIFNTTLPTLTNGQQASLQGDSSGRLFVNVATGTVSVSSGTVTANLGSTDTANLSTVATETTASAGALGTTADTSWSGSGNGSIVALLKNVATKLAGSVAVTGTFWQSTQPVSIATTVNTSDAANGSVTGGTAGSKSELGGLIFNTTLPTLTNGQQASLQCDSSSRLLVNVATGSVTVSSGTVTANLGTTDTGNLSTVATETTAIAAAAGTTADTSWSGSGNGSMVAILKNIATKLAGSVAVTGTFFQATQPVSIAATVNTSDAANGSVTGGTAGSKSELGGLIFNTTLPTVTNGQQVSLQGDSSGRLIVNVGTGTITANLGTTDTGNLSTVATETTAAAGALGTTADTAWSSGSGSVVAILKNIATKLSGSVAVTGTFFQTTQPVSGTVTANAGTGTFNTSDAANGPVSPGTAASKSELVGMVFNSSAPAPTTGQQVSMQSDSAGRLIVNVGTGSLIVLPTNSSGAYANVIVGTTSGVLVAANAATKFLDINNTSLTATVWINIGSTPASVGGTNCIPILPGGSKTWEGTFVPSDAIAAIATAASTNVSVGKV